MSASVCRSCHATIRFVKLDTGRAMPVDPHPSAEHGNVAATKRPGGQLHGHVISDAKPILDGQQRYTPHFASCKPQKTPAKPAARPASLFDDQPQP